MTFYFRIALFSLTLLLAGLKGFGQHAVGIQRPRGLLGLVRVLQEVAVIEIVEYRGFHAVLSPLW